MKVIVLFVETPRKFITAKLSIRKPGSSSVLKICTDEDPGLRIESFAVINLRGVSTNKTIYFIAMKTYKELINESCFTCGGQKVLLLNSSQMLTIMTLLQDNVYVTGMRKWTFVTINT
jgi:hypothetical protein